MRWAATSAQLNFNGTQTLSGTGTVLFGKSGNNSLKTQNSPGGADAGADDHRAREFRHAGAASGTDTIINQGTISADDSGGQPVRFVYDTDVSGGSTSATAAAIDTSGVTNPAPQAVYQSERHRELHLHAARA